MKIFAAVMMGVLVLAGCTTTSYLERRTTPDRAEFGAQVIAVTPAGNGAANNAVSVVADMPGTWKFTLPANVRQVVQNLAAWDRISLYMGGTPVTAEPFMVITVGQERACRVEKEPAKFTVMGKREYVMNGNIALEWMGQTNTGAGFCELIVRRPGTAGEKGDVCHALATARNEEEQKVALGILGSIVWELRDR